MFRSLPASLLWRGLLAVAIGIIAILWPGVTITAVVGIFAVAVFVDAVHQASRAFSSEKAGPVAGHLLLALLDIAAGVVAIAWPGITALALTIWIGAWAVVSGIGEFAMAFASHEAAGQRALFGFGGLLSMALGVALFARPDLGAVSLAEVFGLFSLALGVWSLVLAASAHHTHSLIEGTLRSGA
ncbi:MAG: HdeD family acid-resistance protein [Actinobacteria bacterium]|nr:MAG: HdeD family acid-resistance protein [Actinomycetota bacterium]